MNVLGIFLELLKSGSIPEDVRKKAIDRALDPIEEWMEKDGLSWWEKGGMEIIKSIRKATGTEETPGSGLEDGT